MGPYRPLVVTALLEGSPIPDCKGLATMRMNLMASSSEEPRMMFIASGDDIQVYRFSTLTPSGLPTLIRQLSNPRGRNDESDRTINVIKIGYLGTEEVLVSADEQGEVCVWYTLNLQRDPLLLSVTDSAWGIDIHAEHRLIAISSNAHNVTVFYCGIDSRLTQRLMAGSDTEDMSGTGSISIQLNPSLSTSTTTPIERTSQQILRGHGHNIPCVAFSPCGNFVATASVDRTCRTWRLSDGKQIQEKSLGSLWGWGVCFVDEDSWITLSRSEYKEIPKDHLRPGELPGKNVRDNPLSTTPYTPRRLPPGRDYHRMVRTRWFAGPLHGTSCDEQDSDEDEQGTRVLGNEHSELDDRDAALFGMDDDEEGEDEWEDMTSSDVDDTDDEEDRGSDAGDSAEGGIQEGETSVDTGDDGDDELIGAETEDGGITTEDGIGDSVRRKRPAAALEASDFAGSSSEYERQSQSSSSRSRPPTELDSSVVVDTDTSDREHPGDRAIQESKGNDSVSETEEHVVVVNPVCDPSKTSSSSPSVPRFPKELLLCATSRNIYLLGQNRSRLTSSLQVNESGSMSDRNSSSQPMEIEEDGDSGDDDDDDDDDEDDDDDMDITDEEEDRSEVPSRSQDENENEDESESEYQTGTDEEGLYYFGGFEESGDDGDEDEDDAFGDHSYGHTHSTSGNHDATHNSRGIPLLHTLSVARSAVARADGRRIRHLDHFDRLFVMSLIPELGVLVAASQKGSITIFRLLRVLEDPPATTSSATGKPTEPRESVKTKGTAATTSIKTDPTANRSSVGKDHPTIINPEEPIEIGGAKYVLFPESYLPRLEAPPFPLFGVSISPLRSASASPPIDRGHQSLTTTFSTASLSSRSTRASTGTTSSASSSSAFILHIAYLDSQLYSYEIRLRNERDDPVGLSSVFV